MQGNYAIAPPIRDYLESRCRETPLMLELRAWIEENEEAIAIDPLEGQFLATLTHSLNPGRVLEIGTHVGYSGLWFLRAMSADSHFVTLEKDSGRAARARAVLEESAPTCLVEVVCADARDWLAAYEGPEFDLVFLDSEKIGYLDIFDLSSRCLSQNGVLVVDNALHKGRVTAPEKASTKVIADLNEHLLGDNDWLASIVPLGDGLLIATRR